MKMKPMKRNPDETQQEFNKRAQAAIREFEASKAETVGPSKRKRLKTKKAPRKYDVGRYYPHC